MAKYELAYDVCCTGCGALLEKSTPRKEIYVDEFSSDSPGLRKMHTLYLCNDCAAAFDKALERAAKLERKE